MYLTGLRVVRSIELAERYGQDEERFNHDLPFQSQPEIGKVLVTGASGYIGGRLVTELLARGYHVRAMVRAVSPVYEVRWPAAEIVVADALQPESLRKALQDVHTAYYLIHSLLLGPEAFVEADLRAAINFQKAAELTHVTRIIYLGALGDIRSGLSDHLSSRMQVAKKLAKGKVPVTVLRAAIIIGSGSAPYEIIQHLVKKLIVIPIPSWAKNRCHPIAIRDVIKYLVGFLEIPQAMEAHIDIGGQDVLTYEQMLRTEAKLLGKKRIFLNIPFSNTRLFAYLSSLLTPVPAQIIRCLMEGLGNDVVCQNQVARKVIPFQPLTYRQAVIKAMSREEQDKVYSKRSDAKSKRAKGIPLKVQDNTKSAAAGWSVRGVGEAVRPPAVVRKAAPAAAENTTRTTGRTG